MYARSVYVNNFLFVRNLCPQSRSQSLSTSWPAVGKCNGPRQFKNTEPGISGSGLLVHLRRRSTANQIWPFVRRAFSLAQTEVPISCATRITSSGDEIALSSSKNISRRQNKGYTHALIINDWEENKNWIRTWHCGWTRNNTFLVL